MPSQPKIRAAWYFVDRDVAQVCRDRDDLTVPTVSEVHTPAEAHEVARIGRPYCGPNDFVGSPGSQGLVPTQLRLKRHIIAHPVVYLSTTSSRLLVHGQASHEGFEARRSADFFWSRYTENRYWH